MTLSGENDIQLRKPRHPVHVAVTILGAKTDRSNALDMSASVLPSCFVRLHGGPCGNQIVVKSVARSDEQNKADNSVQLHLVFGIEILMGKTKRRDTQGSLLRHVHKLKIDS